MRRVEGNPNAAITSGLTYVQSPGFPQAVAALQPGVLALCGVLTGQHLIVEVAPGTNAMAATLNIDPGAVAGNRMWKILVKCVECDSADRAPMGCNQFFTDASGRISSFNGPQAITDGTHRMIDNLEYTICFRQIAGMCGVRLTQSRQGNTAPDSFALATAAAMAVAANSKSVAG